jgi:hypothetical protein
LINKIELKNNAKNKSELEKKMENELMKCMEMETDSTSTMDILTIPTRYNFDEDNYFKVFLDIYFTSSTNIGVLNPPKKYSVDFYVYSMVKY